MINTAAILACAILAALAVFQAALVAGAPLGRFAWGGAHVVLPRRLRIGSLVSIVLYGLFVMILLDRSGIIDVLGDGVSRVGAWVLVAYFALGIPLNALSRSRPERFTMTPVVTILCALSAIVAASA